MFFLSCLIILGFILKAFYLPVAIFDDDGGWGPAMCVFAGKVHLQKKQG